MSQTAGTDASSGGRRRIKRALVSVYDKAGLVEMAMALADAGIQIVSTGSTWQTIAESGIEATRVEDLTGFPEILDGRVKTLHPNVHGGLLADKRNSGHVDQLAEHRIEAFDLLVSNLYPFRETVASGAGPDECVEQIDIGGPAMVRAAAKNHASVAVVTSPDQYPDLVQAARTGGFTLAERQHLAAAAFAHTASYDVAVASWMSRTLDSAPSASPGSPAAESSAVADGFPAFTGDTWEKAADLRYGENPHQRAALYRNWRPGLAHAEQLHGKEMSYNNYVDADAARRAAYDFSAPAVAIIKHANPCGIALGADIAQAHKLANACDPVSAYGGVIAANLEVSKAMAEQVAAVFTEVIVAPAYSQDALEVLQAKKNLRILRVPADRDPNPFEYRPISGGLLVQSVDRFGADGDDVSNWRLASGEAADSATLIDLQFAWRAVRATKSNAILLANDRASVGIGMGQVNRVDSCRLAVSRAGERATGSVVASDAFFPFADGLEILLAAGVRAVVQPGGSIRDDEVIAAARAAGVTMYTTGARHFMH